MFLRIARSDPETTHNSRRKGTPHEIASATTDFKKGGGEAGCHQGDCDMITMILICDMIWINNILFRVPGDQLVRSVNRAYI
jgi:hypothetical protein